MIVRRGKTDNDVRQATQVDLALFPNKCAVRRQVQLYATKMQLYAPVPSLNVTLFEHGKKQFFFVYLSFNPKSQSSQKQVAP